MGLWQDKHSATIDPERFRGHDQYLEQRGDYPATKLVAHAWERGRGSWLDWGEDGAFGCVTFDVAGRTVSRDLLDSIVEIDLLDRWLPRFGISNAVDIGGGYGRLVHRLDQFCPELRVEVWDPIEASRDVCDRYLEFRKLPPRRDYRSNWRSEDLAINVHSWSECTRDEVSEGLQQIPYVPWLFVVPHNADFGTYDGKEFRSAIDEAGFRLYRQELAYPACCPRNFYLFKRGA